MDIKEAVKFTESELKTYKEILESFGVPEMKKEKEEVKNAITNYKDVIKLLKRCEKYKKVIEEYKKYLDRLPTGCNSLKLYRLLKKYSLENEFTSEEE